MVNALCQGAGTDAGGGAVVHRQSADRALREPDFHVLGCCHRLACPGPVHAGHAAEMASGGSACGPVQSGADRAAVFGAQRLCAVVGNTYFSLLVHNHVAAPALSAALSDCVRHCGHSHKHQVHTRFLYRAGVSVLCRMVPAVRPPRHPAARLTDCDCRPGGGSVSAGLQPLCNQYPGVRQHSIPPGRSIGRY